MRMVLAWIAYKVVMLSPVSIFKRRGVGMRLWARVCLPMAGDWAYRKESRKVGSKNG